MRRSLLLFALVILFTLPLAAQVPNSGFESWTSGSPDGWFTSNSGSFIAINKSSIAHSGSASARGDVLLLSPSTIVLPPLLQVGASGQGFAYTQRPAALNGYFVYFPLAGSGDQLFIDCLLYKGGSQPTTIASGAKFYTSTVSSFTQFSVPLTYLSAGAPDTCIIIMEIMGPASGGQAHQGSYFMVDDLAFGAATGVGSTGGPSAFRLEQNYPNPFNPSTSISYQLTTRSNVSLKVYNVLGAEVASLLDVRQQAGHYSVTWNAGNLPSGVYLYQLVAVSESGEIFRETRRATLLK